MRGCQSAAMLDMMGMTSTVCESIEQYVELAVALATDPARRAEVKRMIAAGKREIYRDRSCIVALEEFLETVARSAGEINRLPDSPMGRKQRWVTRVESSTSMITRMLPRHLSAYLSWADMACVPMNRVRAW